MTSRSRSHITGSLIPALAMMLSLVGCTDKGDWQYIDRPVLSDEPIQLRVAYVDNPRFEGLSSERLQAILDRTVELVEQQFGLKVRFTEPDDLSVQSFFNNLKQNVKQIRAAALVDPGHVDDAQRQRLRDAIYGTLENYWNDRELVTDFARPYLVSPLPEDDFLKLADRLVETLLVRLRSWYEETSADGRPVLDGSPYNEWVWWDSLGYGNVPYDVVITNQLVASAEYYGMDVHSSLRGGISAGTTTYSRTAQFRSFSWIMVYPMLNDNAVLKTLRDDETYSDQQVVDYSAMLLTHELGHLLLHLGHPFGNRYCVMAPTPLLKYREWFDGIDAARCPLGSEEQMTPGAARIEYHSGW